MYSVGIKGFVLLLYMQPNVHTCLVGSWPTVIFTCFTLFTYYFDIHYCHTTKCTQM